jgi:allantoate deiminase
MVGGARAVDRCDVLGIAPYSDAPDGLFRAWLTPAFARTQDAVGGWMADAGMTVRIDAATNLVGRYEGDTPGAPALVIGSHLDSVRDAGRYDGPLGVMLGIECVAALSAAGRRMPFAIEVYAFGDEEGSRFPAAMLTTRAVAGTLDPALLEVADADGVTVAQALTAFTPSPLRGEGWGEGQCRESASLRDTAPSPNPLPEGRGLSLAARHPTNILAYLEAHIEQGPVLEAEGLPVGIVTGIAAQRRYAVTVSGQAGHAGTTTMGLRRDALTAAAEMVLAVERVATDAGVVGTVGKLDVAPGATNVIPGRVTFAIDVRAAQGADRDAAAEAMLAAIAAIADRRGVSADATLVHDLPASPCDARLMDMLATSVQDQGVVARRLVSGAGHDAMVMAALAPTAMLFIRCAGGISHNPAESVDVADVEVAFQAMLGFIDRLGADRDPDA